MSNAIWA